ncbi:hypothetical protein GOQ29_00340 [Clostridium sp. D2Q-14]|uniref:hypothetical protein n=1 Tax=Anaeromonas gelatinilytica TaxID=2683194 RepID=UPI00193B52AE|nr:hypothetical protein [Anaeromonas gelatinilytica]MBS4534061.1 hypothetical protein [Anaeromonas gelatinilytica]
MFGILGGLLFAWLLSIIGFKGIIINGINELFGLSISMAGYYVLFGIIGFITSITTKR